MSIIVAIRFPMSPDEANRVIADNPAPLKVVGEIIERLGGAFVLRLCHDNEFIDLDEWPSLEVYQQFKAEAGEAIATFEAALGVTSTDEVWTAWRAPA